MHVAHYAVEADIAALTVACIAATERQRTGATRESSISASPNFIGNPPTSYLPPNTPVPVRARWRCQPIRRHVRPAAQARTRTVRPVIGDTGTQHVARRLRRLRPARRLRPPSPPSGVGHAPLLRIVPTRPRSERLAIFPGRRAASSRRRRLAVRHRPPTLYVKRRNISHSAVLLPARSVPEQLAEQRIQINGLRHLAGPTKQGIPPLHCGPKLHVVTDLCHPCLSPQPIVGTPVHSPWLRREGHGHIGTPPEPPPVRQRPRRPRPRRPRRLRLPPRPRQR